MAVRPLEIGLAGTRTTRDIEIPRTEHGPAQPQLAARVTALGRPMTAAALSCIERKARRCDIDDFVATAHGASPRSLFAGSPSDRNDPERAEHSRRSPVGQTGDAPHH
ncbi:XRE family transcriptional regulator [Streptomyces sp. NPDC101150]|uniref:XRE family transcriptional regulator n=1 Tax=Streptomyces sp. NPDC101150 TaxID=3366114 RepID=UPI00381D411E